MYGIFGSIVNANSYKDKGIRRLCWKTRAIFESDGGFAGMWVYEGAEQTTVWKDFLEGNGYSSAWTMSLVRSA